MSTNIPVRSLMIPTSAFVLSTPAYAFSNDGGTSPNAPGQEKVIENCFENAIRKSPVGKQGKKEGFNVANCDHSFNENDSNS